MLLGIHKTLCNDKVCKFVNISNTTIIEIMFNSGPGWIIPVYINCNGWNEHLQRLSDVILELRSENVLVSGDCNARIGEEQGLNYNPEMCTYEFFTQRRSQDKKLDSNGKKILELCSTFGLSVLNGRTKGDPRGELTFHRGSAVSTVDYAFAGGAWLRTLENLEVQEMVHSDHQPLVMTANIHKAVSTDEKLSLLPKLKWNPHMASKYESALNEWLRGRTDEEFSAESGASLLIEGITNVEKSLQPKRNNRNQRAEWFDDECLQARRRSFSRLRKAKRTGAEEDLISYNEANKQFKLLCSIKKSGVAKLTGTITRINK